MENKKLRQLEDTQIYRKIIYNYLRYNELDYICTTITDIKIFERNDDANDILIEIETHRPGLLIGKQGQTIDNLHKRLKDETKKEIKIGIEECKLWINLYN